MNTYELDIYHGDGSDKPCHYYFDCDENELMDNLYKITQLGVLTEFSELAVSWDGNVASNFHVSHKRFIPASRIIYIDVKILERVQSIQDVSDSIKAALTEKEK